LFKYELFSFVGDMRSILWI